MIRMLLATPSITKTASSSVTVLPFRLKIGKQSIFAIAHPLLHVAFVFSTAHPTVSDELLYFRLMQILHASLLLYSHTLRSLAGEEAMAAKLSLESYSVHSELSYSTATQYREDVACTYACEEALDYAFVSEFVKPLFDKIVQQPILKETTGCSLVVDLSRRRIVSIARTTAASACKFSQVSQLWNDHSFVDKFCQTMDRARESQLSQVVFEDLGTCNCVFTGAKSLSHHYAVLTAADTVLDVRECHAWFPVKSSSVWHLCGMFFFDATTSTESWTHTLPQPPVSRFSVPRPPSASNSVQNPHSSFRRSQFEALPTAVPPSPVPTSGTTSSIAISSPLPPALSRVEQNPRVSRFSSTPVLKLRLDSVGTDVGNEDAFGPDSLKNARPLRLAETPRHSSHQAVGVLPDVLQDAKSPLPLTARDIGASLADGYD
jgi:hypothetical protein